MSERFGRRFQFFVLAARRTAREFGSVLGTCVSSTIGLMPATNRLTACEAEATQLSADDYAASVMSVIEYVIGPER